MTNFTVWKNEVGRKCLNSWFDRFSIAALGPPDRSVRHTRMDTRVPPLVNAADLDRLTMPVLVLGGAGADSYPSLTVLERVRSYVRQEGGGVIA